MRNAIQALFVLLVATGLVAAQDSEDGVIKNEEFNFEVRTPPDSVDWEIQEIDKDLMEMGRKAHFRTVFADSDPPTYADFYLSVTPMSKDLAFRSLDKIAKLWAPNMEDHLDNKRERRERKCKLSEQEAYEVDVKGDYQAGLHQRTWVLAKNGKFIYTLVFDRNYRAVGDELLEEEIQAIRDSFKFLRIEKFQAHKKGGKGGEGPGGVGGAGGPTKPKPIDPKLLEKEKFKEPFWRFECEKPEGLVKKELTDNDLKNDIKYHFVHDKKGSRLMIRIYAQTQKAKRWTLEQLVQHKIDYFDKEVKQAKKPDIDKKVRFPMAKDAVRIEMVGRKKTTIRRIWILADCKNDRQYQIEIYVTGTAGMSVWGKTIDAFLKKFKPVKK